MAGRTEARIFTAIWEDADFRALPRSAQAQFFHVLSLPELNHAGVLPIRERRWAKAAADLTPQDVIRDLETLAVRRFLIIDEETDEIFVRSLMRRDKVCRKPFLFTNAAEAIDHVESPVIRAAIAAELERIAAGGDAHESILDTLHSLVQRLRATVAETHPETVSQTVSHTVPETCSGGCAPRPPDPGETTAIAPSGDTPQGRGTPGLASEQTSPGRGQEGTASPQAEDASPQVETSPETAPETVSETVSHTHPETLPDSTKGVGERNGDQYNGPPIPFPHTPLPTPEAAERPDVERLCQHLADCIERNGSKRPAIGKKWRDAARLLIDKDGRTEEQVHRAIDWCQDDEFWRSNILSMPKLREKYDQLRLKATRQLSPGTNGVSGHGPRADVNAVDWSKGFNLKGGQQ